MYQKQIIYPYIYTILLYLLYIDNEIFDLGNSTSVFHENDSSDEEDDDAGGGGGDPQPWGASGTGSGVRRPRSGTISATTAIDVVRAGSIGCTEEEWMRR